jgi:hypothetical protein
MTNEADGSGGKPCSVSIYREAVTKITIEYLEVKLSDKSVHVTKTTTDDCDSEVSICSVVHHVSPGLESMTKEERETVETSVLRWKFGTSAG